MDDLVRKENSVCDDKEFVLLSVCLCLCDMIVFFMNVMWRRLGMCCKPIKITKKNVWTLTEVLWKKKRSRIMWIRSNIMLVCNRGIRINLVVCSPRLFFILLLAWQSYFCLFFLWKMGYEPILKHWVSMAIGNESIPEYWFIGHLWK